MGLLFRVLAALCFVAALALADEAPDALWRARLDEGRDTLVAAQVRVQEAREAYLDWRQRRYPRGARKAELVEEVEAAEEALTEAETDWEELLEEARRDGVLPGTLRDYE